MPLTNYLVTYFPSRGVAALNILLKSYFDNQHLMYLNQNLYSFRILIVSSKNICVLHGSQYFYWNIWRLLFTVLLSWCLLVAYTRFKLTTDRERGDAADDIMSTRLPSTLFILN